MPIVGKWCHELGFSSSAAVFIITRLLTDFEASTFWVDYGVWENMKAFENKSPAMYTGQDVLSFSEVEGWPGVDDNCLDFIDHMEKHFAKKALKDQFQLREE